jgi:hypothetical protein
MVKQYRKQLLLCSLRKLPRVFDPTAKKLFSGRFSMLLIDKLSSLSIEMQIVEPNPGKHLHVEEVLSGLLLSPALASSSLTSDLSNPHTPVITSILTTYRAQILVILPCISRQFGYPSRLDPM